MITAMQEKVRAAKDLLELTYSIKTGEEEKEIKLVSPEFILRKILNMPEEYVVDILKEIERSSVIVNTNKEGEQKIEDNNDQETEDFGGGSDFGGSMGNSFEEMSEEEPPMDNFALDLEEEGGTPTEEIMPESFRYSQKRKKDIKKLAKKIKDRKKE